MNGVLLTGVTSSILPFTAAPVEASLGLSGFVLDLEAAIVAIRRAALALENEVEPVIDLGPTALALEQTFCALFDAVDGRADRAVKVHAAIVHLDEAAAEISAAVSIDPTFKDIEEHLARGRRALVAADARHATRLPEQSQSVPANIRASIGLPRLHGLTRPSLAPKLRVLKPPPAPIARPVPPPAKTPTTFEELAAAVAAVEARASARPAVRQAVPPPARPKPERASPSPPGFAREVLAAIDEVAFIRNRARECFEEVAMVGMQRVPLLGDDWRNTLVLDRRMLSAIDVLAALGPVAIEHLPALFSNGPVKDPAHGFAIAMALGCFGGRDALAAAEYALLGSERDEAFVEEFGNALKLVPHDALPLALRSLSGEQDPHIRAMALDVLGHRGLVSVDELIAGTRDTPRIAAVAFRHLLGAHAHEARGALETIGAIEDSKLRQAVWMNMGVSSHPQASRELMAGLDSEDADIAALVMAITGDEDDAREVLKRAQKQPTGGLVTAIGWTGSVSALFPLVELLEDGNDAVAIAAGAALARITGALILERAEATEEDLLIADPPEPDLGAPPARKVAHGVSDPRDLPAEPAPARTVRPSTDPASWRAYLRANSPPRDPKARYRRGHLYTPLVSLNELDTGTCTAEERSLLQYELIARTGSYVRFDPYDFVPVQEDALRTWRPLASRASESPGRWGRAR